MTNFSMSGGSWAGGTSSGTRARRRRWSKEDRARIVAESLDPATTSSAVARRYGLHASQLFVWRQQLQRRASAAQTLGGPGFVPVLLAEGSAPPAEAVGRMEIALGPAEPLAADDGAHGGIAGEPLGVVDVLVAGQPAVDRLPQEAEQPVADVLPAPALGEGGCGRRGQAEGVVQLAVGEQTAVGGGPGPMELELEPTVEGDPERLFRFTRRVRHPASAGPLLCA